MNKRRLSTIDALYTLGVFLVVLGHSHYSDWTKIFGTFLETMLNYIYVFHMPLFFCIAGFLFYYSQSLEKLGYGKWIGNKIIRMMTPYIVLSVIALAPIYYFNNRSFSGMGRYIIDALLIPRQGVWGHFWFLPALLFMYMFFGIFKKYMKKDNQYIIVAGLFLVTVLFYFSGLNNQLLGINDLKGFSVYFMAGILICIVQLEKEIRLSAVMRIAIILVGVVGSVLLYQFFYGNKMLMMLAAFLMIGCCWQIAGFIGENDLCRWICSHNFTIYIYSWPFQAVMMVIAGRIGLGIWITMILMFMAGICGPVVMIIIYEKCKFLHNRFFDLVLGVR